MFFLDNFLTNGWNLKQINFLRPRAEIAKRSLGLCGWSLTPWIQQSILIQVFFFKLSPFVLKHFFIISATVLCCSCSWLLFFSKSCNLTRYAGSRLAIWAMSSKSWETILWAKRTNRSGTALDSAERKVVFGFVRKPTCDACVFKLESNMKCLRRQVGWKKKSCSWVLMSTDITFFRETVVVYLFFTMQLLGCWLECKP